MSLPYMTADPRRAIFRADASSAIGAGHAMRCLSLAQALAAAGWNCVLASGRGANDALPSPLPSGIAGVELAGGIAAEPDELVARWPGGCDIFVVDNYRIASGYEGACRPWARRILVLDDLADRPHDCDLLLDSAACRKHEDYAGLVPEGSTLLLGPAYLPLRPAFSARRRSALKRRALTEQPHRLLLSFGATDPGNATSAVLDILMQSQQQLAVDILLGASSRHLESVRLKAESAPFPVCLHVGIDNVADLLSAADLAIGAGGGGAWERCCLGLPTLLLCTAKNQHGVAESLRTAGAALVLGDIETMRANDLIDGLQGLIADGQARRAMAQAAASLCDGLGARRMLAELDPPPAHDGKAIRLRPAVAADAERLLTWQRDSRTRRHSRNPVAPDLGEHLAWFTARLGDPECLLNIIMHGDAPAGVLRLDSRAEDDAYEISIYVAPDRWRLGIGRVALDLARTLLPEAELWAEVLANNEASHALFGGAGYRAEGTWYISLPDAGHDVPGVLKKSVL